MKKVIKYIIYNFILIFVVLCCAMCYFANLHKDHKLMKIEDKEEIEKENISVDISTKDLEENKNKIEELKTKIQNEMINIDNTYEKIDKEVTKSYELKHEILTKEENELKDKLKNEVTKIKENLENNLSKINETIRNIERIIKGKKILLEKKDELMIKKLNYISNINKNQKQMKTLLQQPLTNLKILYNENERQIKYVEYYFNYNQFQIAILGIQNSGKSTFVEVLSTGQFEDNLSPTIGYDKKELIIGKFCCNIWDLGGEPRFRDYWEKYCRSVNCIVYVMDSANLGNFESSKIELQKILKFPSVANIPLLVIGNKNDLPGSLNEKEVIEVLELNNIKDRELACYSISCKNMNNISNIVRWLENLIKKNKY